MPDLTVEYYYHCETAENWSTTFKGSSGTDYTVRYGATPLGRYQYDYSCSCSSFKYKRGVDSNGYCKHIRAAEKDHCKWMAFHDGGDAVVDPTTGDPKCPKCGSDCRSMGWGV